MNEKPTVARYKISDAELQEYLKNKTSVSVPQEIPTSAVAFPESTGNSNNQITETLPASTVQQSIPTDTRVNTYITGYVVHTNEGLNIRREPSVQSDITGRLMPSQEIKIYEQVTNGATTWGRTDNGWVSMDYISTDPDSVGQAFRDQHTDAFDVGYVHADGGLNIRSGPGPSYNQVGRLSNGDCVAIFEYQDVGGTTWGRIDRGWISMDYVSQDAYYSSSALEPDQYIIDTYVGGWVDDYNRDFCITISYNMTDGN